MKRSTKRFVLLAIDIPIAIILAVTVASMIYRYVQYHRQFEQYKVEIAEAEESANEDLVNVPELQALLDEQTEASLEREERNRTDSVLLAVSAVLFLVFTKSVLTLGKQPSTSMQRIEAEKQRGTLRGRKKRSGSSPGDNGQETDDKLDLSIVDKIVAEEGTTSEAAIPILQRIQTHYRYLPDEALQRVCELTEIQPPQISGVSTFYSQFRQSPVGKHIIKVCHGTACHVSGAREVTDEIRRRLQIPEDGDTDAEKLFTVEEVACLGCCSLAPVIMIDETTAGKLTPGSACDSVEDFRAEHTT